MSYRWALVTGIWPPKVFEVAAAQARRLTPNTAAGEPPRPDGLQGRQSFPFVSAQQRGLFSAFRCVAAPSSCFLCPFVR